MRPRGPMFRVDVRDALDILCPRYHSRSGEYWPIGGRVMMINSRKVTKRTMTRLTKLVTDYSEQHIEPQIRWVDVCSEDVWLIQRALTVSHVQYLLKKLWKWQRWQRDRLPLFLRYSGKLIVWNGTHRTTICRLANRRCRGRVIDLDAFLKGARRG